MTNAQQVFDAIEEAATHGDPIHVDTIIDTVTCTPAGAPITYDGLTEMGFEVTV